MADGYVVEAAGVTKRFRDSRGGALLTAVDCLDIRAARGKMTALIGPDGAGKTTFLRMVCGLMFPTEGILSVLGISVADKPADVQRRLEYMPQKFGLYEDLTCMENMNLYADLHGISAEERKERFEKLFHMTGLAPFAQRLAGKLSGGMKQKLGLACTLVRTPELLILDEPTAGVDPLSRRELWEILKDLVKGGHISVLVSTAYMEEAELCDEVYILNKGKVLDRGTPEELRKETEGRCRMAKTPEGIPPRVLQAAFLDDRESVEDAVPEKGNVRFVLKEGVPLERVKAFSCYPRLETESVPSRLEDSFMCCLGKLERKESPLEGFELDYKEPAHISGKVDIEVKNLVRRFGDFTAVDNTSFQVHEGEIFGLLGPNGAGKSTTFKMLCGLLPASSGELSVAGVNLRTARAAARANVGYVAQKFSLYGMLTVRENLEFFGGAYGLPRQKIKERMKEVLSQFGLSGAEDRMAGDLPGGYKQRLSMAAALLHEPKILFLDEPTSGIDPPARRVFWRQITALAAKGTTVIITTHFMDEAEYCDRIMIQDQGKMLILLIGYGLSLDVKNVPVAVVMEDASPTVQDMLSFMDGSDYFDPRYTTSMKEGTEMMNRREVDAIIRVPPNFTENLFRGGSHVQIILWGVDAASARTAESYLEAGLASWQAANASKYMTVSDGLGFVSVTPRQWFNDANTSTWFFIPGLVVLIMTLVGLFLTTMVMAREWERGTLEALFITPVRPIEILLSKMIPYFGIAAIGFWLCMAAARYLYGVPVHGSFLMILLGSVIYLIVTLGMGLTISSVIKNQFFACQVSMLVSTLPTVMLSGFIFDLRSAPAVVYAVGHVLPATYYMELLKSLFLAGNDWALIRENCLILGGYAVFFTGLSCVVTKKRLE